MNGTFNWRNIASLTMPTPVKHFSSTLRHALGEERHFALVEELPYQPRLARNRFRSAISIRPMHLFGHNCDHDYYFELLREEERDAQSIARCFSATMAISGLSRERTELFHLSAFPV